MNATDEDSKLGDGSVNQPLTTPSPAVASTPNFLPADLTTSALKFLSTASPEALGGIVIGLAACTYIVLGKVGLVLIGGLGGVVFHAAWEGQSSTHGPVKEAVRENSFDVVKRLLDMRDAELIGRHRDDEETMLGNSFDDFQPETAAALNELVDAVVRDYVTWWYQPILPNDASFPAAARETLTKFLVSISNHLSNKRPADTFLDFLTNSSSIIIVFLSELASATAQSQAPPAEAVYAYLSAHPDSNLAHVLNERQQMRKFKMIAEDILENFLEKSTYDCHPARIFLREILGRLVLETTLRSCTKPEWINSWIVYLLEKGEPDFSQAIDAGMGTSNEHLYISNNGRPFDDMDGNVGNIGLAKPSAPEAERRQQETKKHMKMPSRAEDATEVAMEEAKRLSQLIAEEDARKGRSSQASPLETLREPIAAVVDNAKVLGHSKSVELSDGNQSPPAQLSFSRFPRSIDSKLDIPDRVDTKPTPVSRDSSISPKGNTRSIISVPSFTNFDQILPLSVAASEDGSPTSHDRKSVSLTLHNANIVIHDDSSSADKGKLRSKPNADYLLQIEPASSDHPGWMIVRRYPDFETLHEVLRRIASVSGVTAFTEQHQSLPRWKEHTKGSLRGELERYLRDACWYQPLAESEGMKRFLEKDQGQPLSASSSKNGFPGLGWPTPSSFENMGKGMLDVLTSAPKGVAEGGKAIGGGITGVLNNIGNIGQKKATPASSMGGSGGTHTPGRLSISTIPRMDSSSSITTPRAGRLSEDSLRPSAIVQTQPSKMPLMERKPSHQSIAEDEAEWESGVSNSARSSLSVRRSTVLTSDPSRDQSRKGTPPPAQTPTGVISLPPPPSEMTDVFASQSEAFSASHSRAGSTAATTRTSTSTAPSQHSPGHPEMPVRTSSVHASMAAPKLRKEPTPLTESETRVAVELLFAVITEMYTLSSAWNIRRTLLTAAKTFLLRPGNPSLTSIQALIQDSVISVNTSDVGIANHIRKLRENTLPTEDEMKGWPAVSTLEENERLRIKARKLLIERGVPIALMGVMGQAATSEAMGRIFDCLQVEELARGFMFGVLLQAARAIIH